MIPTKRHPDLAAWLAIAVFAFTSSSALAQTATETPPEAPAEAPEAPESNDEAAAAELPAAAEVIEAYIEAVGGREALEATKFLTAKGTMTMSGLELPMTMQQASNPPRMRFDAKVPNMGDLAQGYDGTIGWAMNPMTGPQIMTDKEVEQTRRQADLHAVLHLDQIYKTIETVGLVEFGGEKAYEILLKTESGDETHEFYSVASGLQLGTTMKVETAMGALDAVVHILEYADVGKIKMPSVTEQEVMMQKQRMVFTELSSDPIEDSVFALPADIQALAAKRSAKPAEETPAADESAKEGAAEETSPDAPPAEDMPKEDMPNQGGGNENK